MKNQLLSSFFKAFAIISAVIILFFIFFVPPRFVFLHVTTTSGETPKEIRVSAKGLLWPGSRPPSLGNFYFFVIAGGGSIIVWGREYETAEIEIGSTGEIFRGDVTHHSMATILHNVKIRLASKDKNLKMDSYEGVLTLSAKDDPEVLAIHPSYRRPHISLKWLLRNYANKGKDISTLPYIMLTTEQSSDRNSTRFMLDFSHANGGVQEYIPPQGWPTSNRHRRMLYSLNGEAPVSGYKQFFHLPANRASTPYKMGEILFYGTIDGHYCAGIVNTPSRAQVHIQVWVNKKKGDQTVRYIY
jgi:hypothetical protein